ncbi:hypothetical protein BDP27DRAFT_1426215 [Rhodocollybia butyracea]|uniref:Uncharacterized protein n=1 Tax=Rhodocollybia butyracea TaxID=206335 RepID=A0A9P5U1X1_9AGAR|nr:hypothetical protein BDP27DRAFT_1426215 [Rhodocollybia butyracea]
MSPVLQVKLREAFANFAKYAARIPNDINAESNTSSVKKVPALTTLKLICPTLPFFKISEGIDLQPFQLRKLDIRCLAPSVNMKSNDLRRLATLIKPPLEQLTFFIGNHYPSLSSIYSSIIFRQIGIFTADLRELHLFLLIPLAYEPAKSVVASYNVAFEANDFTSGHHTFPAPPPNLERLLCCIASENGLIHGTLGKDDLSYLRFYKAVPQDWLAICNLRTTRIGYLRLVLIDSISEVTEGQVVESLERIDGSLYGLSISGHDAVIDAAINSNTSSRWLDVSFSRISVYEGIFKACTCLRYLECHVNAEILEVAK